MAKHGQAVEGQPNLQYWGPNCFIRARIKVPADLVKAIGKTELVKGLGTQNVGEAIHRSRMPLALFEQKIAEAQAAIGKVTRRTIIYMPFPATQAEMGRMMIGGHISGGGNAEIRFTNDVQAWPTDLPLAGFTWEAGIENWIAAHGRDTPPAAESIEVYTGHLRRFMAYVGSDDMNDATRQHMIDYPEVLQSGSDGGRLASNKTSNNHMASIRAVFRKAHARGKIANDPTIGVVHKLKVSKNTATSRKGFDRTDHARIVAEALKLAHDDPRRWLWLLGATYGARIGEFADAKVSAIRTVHDRLCFDIQLEHRNLWAGRPLPLKNEGSARILPLHSAFEGFGFLAYVETIRATHGPDAPLFPTLPVNRHGKRAHAASEECMGWLRNTLGIEDRRFVFHSTRHCVKTFLRGRTTDQVMDAITGHDDGSVSAHYGETELAVMSEAIEAYIPLA